MVRVTHAGIVQNGVQYVEMAGLSTDAKPTNVATGSLFLEVDTAKWYAFDEDGNQWDQIAGDE